MSSDSTALVSALRSAYNGHFTINNDTDLNAALIPAIKALAVNSPNIAVASPSIRTMNRVIKAYEDLGSHPHNGSEWQLIANDVNQFIDWLQTRNTPQAQIEEKLFVGKIAFADTPASFDRLLAYSIRNADAQTFDLLLQNVKAFPALEDTSNGSSVAAALGTTTNHTLDVFENAAMRAVVLRHLDHTMFKNIVKTFSAEKLLMFLSYDDVIEELRDSVAPQGLTLELGTHDIRGLTSFLDRINQLTDTPPPLSLLGQLKVALQSALNFQGIGGSLRSTPTRSNAVGALKHYLAEGQFNLAAALCHQNSTNSIDMVGILIDEITKVPLHLKKGSPKYNWLIAQASNATLSDEHKAKILQVAGLANDLVIFKKMLNTQLQSHHINFMYRTDMLTEGNDHFIFKLIDANAIDCAMTLYEKDNSIGQQVDRKHGISALTLINSLKATKEKEASLRKTTVDVAVGPDTPFANAVGGRANGKATIEEED